jgi:tetratricopeptide (TPR) repeat protein
LKYAVFLIVASCLFGQSPAVHLAAASKAERSGDLIAAEREYEKALSVRPDAPVYERLGLVRHLQNKFAEAIPAFKQSLRLQPERWASRLFLGIDLYRTNAFDGALAELKRADKLQPGNFEVQFWLGATHLALKSYMPGLEILEKLLQQQPNNLEILKLLAENCDALGATLLNHVADAYPNTPAGLEVHAQALEFEGSNDAALQVYRELLQRDPNRLGIREAIERLKTISSAPQPPSPPATGGAIPSRP